MWPRLVTDPPLKGVLKANAPDVWLSRLTSQQMTAIATVVGAAGALLTALALVGLQVSQPTSKEQPGASTMVAPASTPARSLVVDQTVLLPAEAVADLKRYVGRPAVATLVPVRSVPANEGFWVGWNDRARVWVQFAEPGESPVTVRQGQVVSFTGTVVAHGEAFPREVGVSRGEGAAQLAQQQAHIVVPESRLTVH
jgi:hypothetical protein